MAVLPRASVVTITFVYRDCGCRAKWSGDELVVYPCETHGLEWWGEPDQLKYAGPPTLVEPGHRFPEVHHGDN